jgi:hypothetical protein
MWADFGAGKTHTLYYIESMANQKGMFTTYVEWPKKTTTFVDVYRVIARHFPLPVLSSLFWSCCNNVGVDEVLTWASRENPDFAAILDCLYENNNHPIIQDWLAAEPGVTRRELGEVKVRNPIKNSDDAIRALVILTGLVARSKCYSKLLMMLDEFQRVDQLPPRVRRDVNDGIHTLFNSCPEFLWILLSFSFGEPNNIKYLLTDEVISRADLERIQLPTMSDKQAIEFVVDLLRAYRCKDMKDPFFPFTKESCQAILKQVGRLTPRRIMKGFDLVLRRAKDEMADGSMTCVTHQFALQILKDVPISKDD